VERLALYQTFLKILSFVTLAICCSISSNFVTVFLNLPLSESIPISVLPLPSYFHPVTSQKCKDQLMHPYQERM
jgi:hypothetical protein